MMRYVLSLILLSLSICSYSQSSKLKNIGDKFVSYQSFYEDGSVKEKGLFCENQKCGEWKLYHENGNLNTIAHFKEDKREGVWQFFDLNGLLVYEVEYKDGIKVRVTEHTYFLATK